MPKQGGELAITPRPDLDEDLPGLDFTREDVPSELGDDPTEQEPAMVEGALEP